MFDAEEVSEFPIQFSNIKKLFSSYVSLVLAVLACTGNK